ncbi:MAG: hypothetical protein ACXVEE_33970 [Polyangiales bacterium]
MKSLRAQTLVIALSTCMGAVACGPSKNADGPPKNALDHRIDWYVVDVTQGRDAKGRAIDEIPVRGGDVVRITTDAVGPIEIGERVRSGAGWAETWSKVTPQNGHVVVRTTLLGAAILAPRGIVSRAHIGLGHDPGFDWFELEDRVLEWAAGPLPGPFPAVAPRERIDFAGFEKLDRVLAAAVAKAKDKDKAKNAAIAIRRVVGLRAVRAIRPNDGFPFFYDGNVEPENAASKKLRMVRDKKSWLVGPKDPLVVSVEGPRILVVSSFGVRRDGDERVMLRVREGAHIRAQSGGELPHLANASQEPGPETAAEETEMLPLRRALVHVPPGKHSYVVEAQGSLFTAFQLSEPSVHIGDGVSGAKDETRLLAKAKDTTDPTLLAIANALAGTDLPVAGLEKEAREVAIDLAEGGPRDPLIDLEIRAARGDEKALAALGQAARNVVDDGIRGAWLRGTTRGTRWVVSDTQEIQAGRRWLAMVVPTDRPECAGVAGRPWTEIGKSEAVYASSTWRGASTVELMTASSCNAKGPIALEVDGEKLAASPSSPITRWHVLVRNMTARIKRTDGAEGKVWGIDPAAAACGGHWGFIGAPRVAKDSPSLAWNEHVRAPGIELWVRDGSTTGEVEIVSKVDPRRRAWVRGSGTEGFVAVDSDGARWVRVGRVGVPAWAATDGVTVSGPETVAVRAIVRAAKTLSDPAGRATTTPEGETTAEAEELDEEALIAASREINGSQGIHRANHYVVRALMLARAGEARAAMEDARAAKLLGAKAPEGDDGDVVVYVRAAIRPKPRRALELPEGVAAYGIEPDFDPGSARCAPSTKGPRGKLAAIVDELKTAKAAQTKVWDRNLAIRAWEAVTESAVDPRSASVLSWALAGSRWQVPKAIETSLLKVQRPHEIGGGPTTKDFPIDPDGDLRARIATGMPFDRASYATITEGRPARVALTGSNGVKAHIEIVCIPRSPGDALDYSKCPISVAVGTGAPAAVAVSPYGRANLELPPLPAKGPGAAATISMGPSPGRFIAVARVVFDGDVPGTTKVDGVGYVVMPDGLQWRWLVKSGEELKTNVDAPGLLRIDARAEPEEAAKVVVVVDGKEQVVPIDGTPKIVMIPKAGTVTVRSTGGASTIAIAERVAKPVLPDLLAADEQEADPQHSDPAAEPTGVTSPALLDAGDVNAPWRDTAATSPKPLTPLEESVGTVTLRSLARYGTFREGDPRTDAPDTYFEQSVGYRRRIESIDLWTGITGLYRPREGNDSAGASLFLYKTINPLRIRLAGWVDAYGQKIGLTDARTWHPHGYAEFSGRVTSNFFLLPRVGYDGFYTNLLEKPLDLRNVDDDVYNDFRFRRQTLLYGQLLSWWVPYFNSILWTRTRASFDVDTGSLSHVSFRPGGFFAFDRFEVDVFGEATWFAATEGLRTDSKVNYTGAAYLFYNNWFGNGSLDIQPGVGGRARANDGAWEFFAVINVLASFQRGLRDFASPELNFPEQFGGSVAWRGFVPGGMR